MYQPIMWVVRLLEDRYRPDFVKISRLKGSKSKENGRWKHLAVLGGNYIYNKFKRTKKKWIYRWICKTIIGKKNIYPSYIWESYTNPNPILMASWVNNGKTEWYLPPKSEKFNFSLHWTWEAAKLRSEALFRFHVCYGLKTPIVSMCNRGWSPIPKIELHNIRIPYWRWDDLFFNMRSWWTLAHMHTKSNLP